MNAKDATIMAKKQTSNTTTAQVTHGSDTSSKDVRLLATAKALESYAARVREQLKDSKATLPEGSYAVECECEIQGTVIVEAAGTTVTKARHTVDGDELVAAMLSGEDRPAIRKALKSALTLIAKSRRIDEAPKVAASAKGEIDAASVLVDEIMVELAPSLGLWQEAATKPRAGGTRCKPGGALKGSVNATEVLASVE